VSAHCRYFTELLHVCAIFRHALRLADAIWCVTPMCCRENVCLQWAATFPPKIAFFPGGSAPHLLQYMVPWAHPSHCLRWHLIWFSHFAGFMNVTNRVTDRLTDQPTDHATVCSNRPLSLANVAMRPQTV